MKIALDREAQTRVTEWNLNSPNEEIDRTNELVNHLNADPDAVLSAMESHGALASVSVMAREDGAATVQLETDAPLLLLAAKRSGLPIEMPLNIEDGVADGIFQADIDPADTARFLVTVLTGAATERVTVGRSVECTQRMLREYVQRNLLAEPDQEATA